MPIHLECLLYCIVFSLIWTRYSYDCDTIIVIKKLLCTEYPHSSSDRLNNVLLMRIDLCSGFDLESLKGMSQLDPISKIERHMLPVSWDIEIRGCPVFASQEDISALER